MALVKTLFIAKSAVEVLAGLALVSFPSVAVSLVLGAPLDAPAGTSIGRFAGGALLALGIACWFARNDSGSAAAAGLLAALLFYDVSVVGVLFYTRFGAGLSGIGLWPAVALHTAFGFWSLLCLEKENSNE